MGAFSFIVFTIGLVALLVNTSLQYELQPQLCKRIDNSCKKDDDCCLGTCCFSNECLPSILLYSVTLSLQYQLTATCNNTGAVCTYHRDCCGHTCCQNGYCTPSEDCNPCRDVVCGYKHKCYFDKPARLNDKSPIGICAPEDPCHIPDCGTNYRCEVVTNGDLPPEAKCVQVIDLCWGIECSAFQSCYIINGCIPHHGYGYNALTYPPLPRPVCAYTNPCVVTACKQGFECVFEDNEYSYEKISAARCEPISNPCLGMICGEDEACYIIDNYVQDMNKPIGKCLPTFPCSRMYCRDGFVCTQVDLYPPRAECVLQVDPCANMSCDSTQQCYLEYVICITAPCYPIAVCADPDPCKSHYCPGELECINQSEDQYTAPQAKCVNPNNPCEGFPCGEDQTCTFDQIYCFKEPCIPQPYCIDLYPCRNVTCAVGYECVVVDTGSQIKYGQCYRTNDPCKFTYCPDDSTCVQLKKFPSLGICYDSKNGERNCTEMKCAKGYVCKDFDNPRLSACVPTCETCPANTFCEEKGFPPHIMCKHLIVV